MSTLVETRRSLHAVAEQVLAGPQYRASGELRLSVAAAGFRTYASPALAVERTDLAYDGGVLEIDGRTCASLAQAAGVEVGAAGIYSDGSGLGPDDVLRVSADDARLLAEAWTAGETALRQLAPEEEPILWPEHFDVGIQLDGISYGVSPGDSYIEEPYAYVSAGQPTADPFWNYPFGAARPVRELASVLDFFTQGRRLLG